MASSMKTFDIRTLYKQSNINNMNGDNPYISEKARRRNADPSQLDSNKIHIPVNNKTISDEDFLLECESKNKTFVTGEISTTHAISTTKGFVRLTDVTFIIPIKIDSDDRLQNFYATINYLTKNFDTNIVIYESDTTSKLKNIVPENITHIFEKNTTSFFHRTRYLNYMLNMSKTPITVNYDIDVVLPVESYVEACEKILNENCDLIYPYGYGNFQTKINKIGRNKLISNSNLNNLTDSDFESTGVASWYGHCQFFKTDTYKKYGGENEYFISYGPEDLERYSRFVNLETKVEHLQNRIVYHIEHDRGLNSCNKNPFFGQNDKLYNILRLKSKEFLENYYTNVEYIQKYKI